MNMDRGRWDTTGYRPEWDIKPSLSNSARFYQKSLRHWLNLGLASKTQARPSTPSFTLTKTIIEKVRVKHHPDEKKLPVIEKKQPWMPPKPDKRWSFSSRAFNFPRTAFGTASKSKRLPSMEFKRVVPSYVFKSRHATKEQIALQAKLRRTLSRQKIKRFKKKLNKVFEEKAALTIECAFRQSRARKMLMKKRAMIMVFDKGVDAVTKIQTLWRYRKHIRYENEQKLNMDNIARLMAFYDEDGSGTIDREELQALLEDLHLPSSHEEVERWFDKMDHDGSGEVDVVELYHAFPPSIAAVMRSQGMFFDDHDGAEEDEKQSVMRGQILDALRNIRLHSSAQPADVITT